MYLVAFHFLSLSTKGVYLFCFSFSIIKYQRHVFIISFSFSILFCIYFVFLGIKYQRCVVGLVWTILGVTMVVMGTMHPLVAKARIRLVPSLRRKYQELWRRQCSSNWKVIIWTVLWWDWRHPSMPDMLPPWLQRLKARHLLAAGYLWWYLWLLGLPGLIPRLKIRSLPLAMQL